jgi:hypothetical protein
MIQDSARLAAADDLRDSYPMRYQSKHTLDGSASYPLVHSGAPNSATSMVTGSSSNQNSPFNLPPLCRHLPLTSEGQRSTITDPKSILSICGRLQLRPGQLTCLGSHRPAESKTQRISEYPDETCDITCHFYPEKGCSWKYVVEQGVRSARPPILARRFTNKGCPLLLTFKVCMRV